MEALIQDMKYKILPL